MADFGIVSLVPTLTALVLAIVSHRTVEALVAGSFVGLLIIDPLGAIPALASTALTTFGDQTVQWIILVCGLLGSLIAVLTASGAAAAFGGFFLKFVDSKIKSLLATTAMGILIFIDDYLNTLAVSSSMRSVTKRFGVSKEMLAYVVDSTAAPISLLIPISTWAIFFASLIESNGIATAGQGLSSYIGAIPYMFYAWAALVLVILVAAGKVPAIGAMKYAEHQTEISAASISEERSDNLKSNRSLWSFLVPMGSLVFFTVWFEIDIFPGVIAALLITIPFMLLRKSLTAAALFDALFKGFEGMLHPLATVFAGFMLKEVNGKMGLTNFAIETITPLMTAGSFPVLCFLLMGLLAFATSSAWGIFVVAFPIVIPVANSVGADTNLVLGALLSASVFGSHACFYSDSTVLAAKGSGCTPYQHAITQLPYSLIAAGVACLLFALIPNV